MSKFKCENGDEWTIEFDGLILADVEEATKIDLADLSAGGLAAIETDAKALVKVLLVLCGDEIGERGMKPRTFAKGIVGNAIERAFACVVSAAGNFFPPKQWSEIQSHLTTQREFKEQTAMVKPMMALLEVLPEGMRAGAMEALHAKLASGIGSEPDTTSEASEESPSATGPDSTPATPVPVVQESAELTPVG